MAGPPRLYLEASCFNDIAIARAGDKVRQESRLSQDRLDQIWYYEQFFRAHKAKDIEVITSFLTVVEASTAGDYLDDDIKNTFNNLLLSGQYVSLVAPSLDLVVAARQLRWDHNASKRKAGGCDLVHLRTAIATQCQEFVTSDGKIIELASDLPNLGVRAIRASETRLLPMSYRQTSTPSTDPADE